MAIPSVQRFGTGYIQGAELAAKEDKLTDVEVKYYYAGAFQSTPAATATATSWYSTGTEAIFACGGKVYQSVDEACKKLKQIKNGLVLMSTKLQKILKEYLLLQQKI